MLRTSGDGAIGSNGLQAWFLAASEPQRAQRCENPPVQLCRSESEASKGAVETATDEIQRYSHFVAQGTVLRDRARGLQSYQCKGSGRTFDPLPGQHHKDLQPSPTASLTLCETGKASLPYRQVMVNIGFRRHCRSRKAVRHFSGVVGTRTWRATRATCWRHGRVRATVAQGPATKATKSGPSRNEVPVVMPASWDTNMLSSALAFMDAKAQRSVLQFRGPRGPSTSLRRLLKLSPVQLQGRITAANTQAVYGCQGFLQSKCPGDEHSPTPSQGPVASQLMGSRQLPGQLSEIVRIRSRLLEPQTTLYSRAINLLTHAIRTLNYE